MKKINIILGMAIILGMMSCDKLKEPYFTEPLVAISDTIKLEEADTVNFDGKIVVLLEDFTGVQCQNCPSAAAVASSLQTSYGEKLIVLGVHPKTNFQNPAGGAFPDFRTNDAEAWRVFNNIEEFPNGMVNRLSVVGSSNWASEVGNLIGGNAPVRLIVKTDYNDANRELRLSVHSKFLTDVNGDIRLTVCMMEDNITGRQKTNTGVDDNYLHRHVFRGTADGFTWGRPLDSETTTIVANRNFITNMKFTLDEAYNADEFYIVAFISDDSDKHVVMAAEAKIK